MSIKEKKAIEKLEWAVTNRFYIDTHGECDYDKLYKAMSTVLGLVEKQNKKIKELEEEALQTAKECLKNECREFQKEVSEVK